MDLQVLLEVGGRGEPLLALVAQERLLLGVDLLVPLEVGFLP